MCTQDKGGVDTCRCPYCDAEIEEPASFCRICEITIVECIHCGEPVRSDSENCPSCGEPPK